MGIGNIPASLEDALSDAASTFNDGKPVQAVRTLYHEIEGTVSVPIFGGPVDLREYKDDPAELLYLSSLYMNNVLNLAGNYLGEEETDIIADWLSNVIEGNFSHEYAAEAPYALLDATVRRIAKEIADEETDDFNTVHIFGKLSAPNTFLPERNERSFFLSQSEKLAIEVA
jgi:hypothetical protein